jgi:cupin 2 domain-containing protein
MEQSDPDTSGNILLTPEHGDDEYIRQLLQRKGLRIEQIVSTGQITPEGEWYDQDEDEWVLLISGNATLAFEQGEPHPMVAGDYLLIPAHCRHRVTFTSAIPPAIWLAIFIQNDHQ